MVGRTTTSFTCRAYYHDNESDPPASGYPKIVTIMLGLFQTNSLSTNISLGAGWSNRLCQTNFTISVQSSKISNYFLVKAITGNTNLQIIPSIKLITRVTNSARPATGLLQVNHSESSITISWTINEPYIASQTIFWNSSSPAINGNFVLLNKSVNSYQINNLSDGVDYHFVIRTFDLMGDFADSTEQVFTTVAFPKDKLAIWNNMISRDHPQAKIFVNNPNNPSAVIIVNIYTLYGKLVKQLANGALNNFNQPIFWDGTDNSGNKAPSGVYIVNATGYNFNEIKRIYVVW